MCVCVLVLKAKTLLVGSPQPQHACARVSADAYHRKGNGRIVFLNNLRHAAAIVDPRKLRFPPDSFGPFRIPVNFTRSNFFRPRPCTRTRKTCSESLKTHTYRKGFKNNCVSDFFVVPLHNIYVYISTVQYIITLHTDRHLSV